MKLTITEPRTKAFCRETVNVVSQFNQLLKNPERKLKDQFAALLLYAAICAVLLAILVVLTILWGASGVMIAAMVLMVILVFFCLAFRVGLGRAAKELRQDTRPSVLTLDEDGVEMAKEGVQTVRLSWNSIAFLRVFREGLCFFPNGAGKFIISVNVSHKDEILSWVRENGVSVRVIES